MSDATTRDADPRVPPTSWTTLRAHRALLAQFDQKMESQEFHILGAGIAGLVAARELLSFRNPDGTPKHSVTLYEGSQRCGGRIRTHRVGPPPEPGQPDRRPYVELGAMRMPESHDYTWTYAREVGLARRKFLNADRMFDFGGKVYRMPEDLEALVDLYRLKGSEREIAREGGPGPLFGDRILIPEQSRLDREYGREVWRRLLVSGRVVGEGLQRIDRLSLAEGLEEATRRGTLSPEGRKFIVDLLYLEDLQNRSLLMFLMTEAMNFGKHLWELCRPHEGGPLGGTDLLVEGLVADLPKGTIRYGQEVMRISTNTKSNWTVEFASGERIRQDAKPNRHLLCTIPYSKLTFADPVEISLIGFEPQKLAALRGVSYLDATKVGLYCKNRFWDPPASGGRTVTEKVSRATYFPNDGNEAEAIELLPEPGQGALPGYARPLERAYSLYSQPLELGEALDGTLQKPFDETSLPKDWVLLSSYTYGETARRMESFGVEASRQTQRDLMSRFPSIERDTEPDDPAKSPAWSWRSHRWARGALALPAPGSFGRSFRSARAPHRGVFFAGDGASPMPGWIQGAAYSALYAVEHIQRTVLNAGEPDAADEGTEFEKHSDS